MSMRRLAHAFRKKDKKSSASTASSSPTHSPLITPMSSSVSLPDSIRPNVISGSSATPPNYLTSPYPPTGGRNAQRNTQAARSSGKPPSLQDVAPFAYAENPSASSSSSSLPEKSSGNGGPGVRIKRSLSKLLSSKDSEFSDPNQPSPFGQPRRKGLFGSSSFFDENRNGGGSQGWVKRVSNLPGGMVKKAQDALKSASSSAAGMSNKAAPRVGSPMEYIDDEEDDSSISSAPSFVQTAPDEDDRGGHSPEHPLPPVIQAYNNPGAPFLPRSHTNLHALTLTSLAFPPSPHPINYNPALPCFPRSSNSPSKLPRLPTFRAHLAKTRILDRLEAQDLTVVDNESIAPFANKFPPTPNNRPEGDGEPPPEGEIRRIEDEPGWSVGLDKWTKRAAFVKRVRVWRVVGMELQDEEPEPATSYKTQLKLSGGVRALAGLVHPRPSALREIPTNDRSMVIDESMLMDYLEQNIITPPLPISPPPSGSMSPRPLPNPPGAVRSPTPADSPILEPASPPLREDLIRKPMPEPGPPPRIRRLPPRPLPVPPSPPSQITVREVESMDGPVVMTTKVFDLPTSSVRTSLDPYTQNRLSQVMVTSSAPNTPLDPLDSEAVRVSVGSLAAAIANNNTTATESPLLAPRLHVRSLDSTSSSEAAMEHASHSQPQTPQYENRKSMASVRVPIHETPTPQTPRSPQRRSSHASSGAPTPPALRGTLSVPNLEASVSSLVPPEEALEEGAGPELKSQTSPAVVIVEPATVEPEEVPLDPSRISEEHVDPFVIASLKVNTTISPIPSAVSLSPITTSPVPSTSNQSAKSTKRQSSDAATGTSQKSPASSPQSPAVENPDSSTSVKFVKLRRTESAQGSARMRKHLLHNSGRFWPPQRGKDDDTVEEKEECEMEATPSIKSSKSRDVGASNHDLTMSMSQESLASGASSSATKAEKLELDDWTVDAPRHLPFGAATSSHKRNLSDYRRPSLEDGTRGMVSMASAFDLGRSYPTAKSPDNVGTSRWEPLHSPTRTTAKDLVQHMPVAPMSPSRPMGIGRVVHTRSPSSDAAARIEAHLNDVHTARFKAKVGSQGQGRPDFLPMPTIAQLPRGSDVSNVRSISPAASTSTSFEAGNHPAQPQGSSSADQAPSTSRVAPPSRWSEENFRERQRTAGTLPMPTTTISFSAPRTLPIGVSNSASRGTLGGVEPSRTPSIFRPSTQNTVNGRNRTLRM